MPKRAENEIRKRIEASGNPHQIEQLCLDGIQIHAFTHSIKRLLETCSHLEYLTVNDCELRSLDHFPTLTKLIGLQLSDNLLSGDDLNKLAHSQQLNFLTLDNNHIATLSYLNQLKQLPELEILQVHGNEICEEEGYRQAIFALFPKVNIIDCFDREGCKVEEEDPSEYISNIENSRLDLLDLLEEGQDAKSDDFLKTAVEYLEDGLIHRKNSAETTPSPYASLDFSCHSAQRNAFNHKSFMFVRTGVNYDSSQEQNSSDLIKDFKRKLQKKQ